MQGRERLAREAVRKVKKNAAEFFLKEGSQLFYRAHMERADIATLVALAREGDKDAVSILRNIARGTRGTLINVPDVLHEFVWEWFIDGPPKAKSGSSPKDTGLRHATIGMLVKIVSEDYGFPEYGNPEHRGNPDAPMSACRLVAEELGLSERTVEDIRAKYKATAIRPRSSPV